MGEVALRQGAILDDRFMLKRQLGAGGCGAVWLASDADTKQADVVLKILHPHFDRYSLAVKQLAREAEMLAQLAHPNIAKPILFSASGPHTFLVMEYIDGRSLDQEIGAHAKAEKYFANHELLRIFEELCSAVSHAHSRTIIHRDLKPQNVMIIRRQAQIFVKVLDFGIAKLIEGNIFDATTFGRRLGSMFYMSPEQCKGEPADVRSDVFSLGVLLFELITLRRAWAWDPQGRPLRAFDAPVPADGANALSTVLLRVAGGPRPKPSESRPKLPARVDELVGRAMAIEPDRRFQTVDSFLAELRRVMSGMSQGEFAAEVVTVKSAVPAKNKLLPFSDDSDTRMDRAPDPDEPEPEAPAPSMEHLRRSVKMERTEALPEAKEPPRMDPAQAREAARETQRETKSDKLRMDPAQARDAARETQRAETKSDKSVWRVGGLQPSDMAATAMMAQVQDPDDPEDSSDYTIPKVPSLTNGGPPRSGNNNAALALGASILDADSSMTGPTIGVSEAAAIVAAALKRETSETGELPRDILTDPHAPEPTRAPELVREVEIGRAAPRSSFRGRIPQDPFTTGGEPQVVARGVEDGDPHGTVRGALAPEATGENARPSWRGRLPMPMSSDPNATALSPTAAQDPNATALSGAISEPMDAALGFLSTDKGRGGRDRDLRSSRDRDPNATPLSNEIELDRRAIAQGGTELLYAVPEPKQLRADVSDDLTPLPNAAEIKFVSKPEAEVREPQEQRSVRIKPVVETHRASPMYASPPSETSPSVDASGLVFALRSIGRTLHRHRLALVGMIGMVLAFAVGVALARWAAEEVRRSTTVNVPVQVDPQQATPKPREEPAPKPHEEPAPKPREEPVVPVEVPHEPEGEEDEGGAALDTGSGKQRYQELDALLRRLKKTPGDRALIAELRDGIVEATDELANEKTKIAIRRAATNSAKNGDVDGLESALRKLHRAAPRVP